jgi:hypothetical protein
MNSKKNLRRLGFTGGNEDESKDKNFLASRRTFILAAHKPQSQKAVNTTKRGERAS